MHSQLLVISDTCFSSFRLILFMQNMSVYLKLVIPSHLRSVKIPNFGRISRMKLGHWMVATFIVHLLQMNVVPFKIGKVSFLRIVSLDVHSTFDLSLPIQGGRDQRQIHWCTRMLFKMASRLWKANTTLQMPGSHHVKNF